MFFFRKNLSRVCGGTRSIRQDSHGEEGRKKEEEEQKEEEEDDDDEEKEEDRDRETEARKENQAGRERRWRWKKKRSAANRGLKNGLKKWKKKDEKKLGNRPKVPVEVKKDSEGARCCQGGG